MKSNLAPHVMATIHPASILRAPDSEAREQQRKDFVRDLKKVMMLIKNRPATAA
jgi:DNA polymerase